MNLFKTIGNALKNTWDYFRPSWEGPDNKFSYKRFSQFLFMLLMARQMINGIHDQWSFNAFLVLAILFSLTATIITTPDLIRMFKYYSQTKKTDYYTQPIDEALPDTTVVTKTETKPTEDSKPVTLD